MNIPNYDELRKQELIYKILDQQALNPQASSSIKDSLEVNLAPLKSGSQPTWTHAPREPNQEHKEPKEPKETKEPKGN